MYNNYAAISTYWADTTVMDNLRGGDATGLVTPGSQEISFTVADGVYTIHGNGNSVHTYSASSFYRPTATDDDKK